MTEPGQLDAFGRPVREEAPQPPQALLVARWLWIATAVVGAVHSFVQLVDREKLIARLQRLDPKLSQQELDTAANGEVMFAIMLSALTIGCYVLLSNRMLEGRQWGRVVLTVLGGLDALGTGFTLILVAALGTNMIERLTQIPLEPADLLFGSITLIIELVALVVMFQPDANRFFRAARPRATGRPSSPPPTGYQP